MSLDENMGFFSPYPMKGIDTEFFFLRRGKLRQCVARQYISSECS